MTPGRIVDCHAHVIDPARFPFPEGPGYRPRPDEAGPCEAYLEVLDRHGVAKALLVQPSGYGYDNAATMDALARAPGRFKAIVMVAPVIGEAALAALDSAGAVGVRFNLVSHRPDALSGPAAARFLARLRELGWYAQVFADDAQWPEVEPVLRDSGVKVLVDHFGVRNVAAGTGAAGFQAVLRLGREGRAAVKLSAPFRVGDPAALDPYAEVLLDAFGPDGCVWGSDWPFLDMARRPDYGAAIEVLRRWLPDEGDRARVLWDNPVRLFRFGEAS
jgi:predicted TIM-barrel fold metal-dependent hydrolase